MIFTDAEVSLTFLNKPSPICESFHHDPVLLYIINTYVGHVKLRSDYFNKNESSFRISVFFIHKSARDVIACWQLLVRTSSAELAKRGFLSQPTPASHEPPREWYFYSSLSGYESNLTLEPRHTSHQSTCLYTFYLQTREVGRWADGVYRAASTNK